MEITYKFEIGQRVIYEGLIGIIESRSTYCNGTNCYGLISEEDTELSCTADEEKCTLYTDQEINQKESLLSAHANAIAIMGAVGKITDKYFRDGNH